jgi:hypothetical protein
MVMALSVFLSLLRQPRVVSFESSKRKYTNFTVGSVSEWREQQRMEEAAGLVHRSSNIMVPWHFCDICTIGIGPNHEHQHIYLYPVYREKVGLHGEKKRIVESGLLCICESCATWRERNLPEWLCVIGPWAWETNALIRKEGEELLPVPQDDGKLCAQLRLHAMEHIKFCAWYIVCLTAFSCNIPLSLLFNNFPQQENTAKADVKTVKELETLLRQQKGNAI